MWFEDSNIINLMEEWWQSFDVDGTPSYRWWSKLKALKAKLQIWNDEVFGSVDTLIKGKIAEINEIDIRAKTSTILEEEETYQFILKQELHDLEKKKEIK
ncbi:hypothetical protein FRX31_003479 [Thalictrum thalictroides]|uniref:Uncharacterized protein n=1 Tax=Thalictrum thalictroides TaxID=46969 RepID=A0A7J6XAV9_THATH|nr:hypothetical protein FRX31_003479 [Thalictrum thalictroides]